LFQKGDDFTRFDGGQKATAIIAAIIAVIVWHVLDCSFFISS
jgi:hypothetical protein